MKNKGEREKNSEIQESNKVFPEGNGGEIMVLAFRNFPK